MLFQTPAFALFFLTVATIYWSLAYAPRTQNWLLAVTSYAFYATFDPRFVLILFGASWFTYLIGSTLAQGRLGRAQMRLGVVVNLGALGVFKYYGFFRENADRIAAGLGLHLPVPVIEWLLPIGLSFYVFQNIAYLVDLNRGCGVRAESLLDFVVFTAFFPQLILGPICRSHELLPQVQSGARRKLRRLDEAVALIVSGLIKKAVLAEILSARLVNDAFSAPENFSSLELLLAAYAYSAQIYVDFSGYTDIARGCGMLLGFELPENFRHPLAATNVGDFWRRWHMSFSRWLRDYIYFPLGGSRGSKPRTYLNLLITFLLGGLWHGADWRFVLWGAIHGAALVMYKASLDARRALGIDTSARPAVWKLVVGWFLTFHLVAGARIIFRSSDLESAALFFHQMLKFSVQGNGIEILVLLALSVAIAINFVGDSIHRSFVRVHQSLNVWTRPLAWSLLALFVIGLKPTGISPYIYSAF
ncbi:MAG: MBOAT family O-acyltransferase [Myxococcota bacterium]